MSYVPYPIFTFATGLDTTTTPWMLMQDAFQTMYDSYVHNGVLKKRSGIQFFNDFVNSDTTTVTAITNTDPGTITLAAAAGLANGDFFQLRNVTGTTEVNGITYQIANLIGNTFDVVDQNGDDVDFTSFGVFAGAGNFFLVPQEPIMGIRSFIDGTGTLQMLVFNTKRGCIYNTSTQQFDPLDTADIFAGDESSFISSAAFGRTKQFTTPTFFFTNFNGDTGTTISPIRTYTSGNTTTQFVPDSTPATSVPPSATRNYIVAAQFIFAMRQRLLLLNTVESTALPVPGPPPVSTGTNFAQRMRWSRINNPADSGNEWDEITPGNGGFVDAPTSEVIIGATQLQDVIVVQFTSSIWTIKPTADPAQPFRWDKVNSFRASDAPYGNIGHDRYVVSFGKRGIVASDTVEVQRIDNKIENFMMTEVNADFMERMYSARNYSERRSWTLYPAPMSDIDTASTTENETSNRALIRTEEESAWSIYRVATTDLEPDTGTNLSCLGFGEVDQDLAFQDFTGALDLSFEQFGSETWSSYYIQAKSEVFFGGDQKGRVLFLEKDGDDLGTPINFEVISAGWNPFKEKGIEAQLGYVDFYVDADPDTNFTVEFYSNDIDAPYASQTLNCLPPLGFIADIQTVTLNNPVEITAYSHGLITGASVFIYDLTGAGQLSGGPYTITVIDSDNFSLDGVDGTAFDAYVSGGQVVEREFENTKCIKRAYAGGKGYQHFIRITNSGMDDVLNFNSIVPWFRPTGSRMIG